MTGNKHLILASASPRRRELLALLGVDFEVMTADIDETPQLAETPADYVARLAREKARAVAERQKGKPGNSSVVLGSDTSVIIDSHILGKPEGKEHAIEMLLSLAGRWHEVLTAVCVTGREKEAVITVASRVRFAPLAAADAEWYWNTGEPADKAGAYGIQGYGGAFVERIEGSYSAIVGLPLCETARLLKEFGVRKKTESQYE